MKHMKKVTAMLLALTMILCLCACGGSGSGEGVSLNDIKQAVLGYTTDDFYVLLKGNLDEIYLGKFDSDYMALIETTEAECLENYEIGIDYEVDYFCYYFALEYPTDEFKARVADVYKEIYSHSKYVVGEVSQLDENTFVSKVVVSPINIIELTVDAINNGGMDHFWDKYPDEVVDAMSEDEYMAYDREWGEEVLKLLQAQLPNIGYCEDETLAMQIALENNTWSVSSSDLQTIDEIIIYYP